MKENSIYDKKSLRAILGKTADFSEIAKDVVAFSNAEGGTLDIGIEDCNILPPATQQIPESLPIDLVNRIGGLTQGVSVFPVVRSAENGGQYISLSVPRNPNAVAMTSSGEDISARWRQVASRRPRRPSPANRRQGELTMGRSVDNL
jgi:ATP-dependent DNA helicase RecG